MPDQAAGLRSLFAKRRPSLLIVAGGDPGKAAVAVHFARESAGAGRATLLIDGTPGQAAAACDVSCRYELAHVLAGDLPVDAVIKPLTADLLLLPAARALSRFGALAPDEEARLHDVFATGIGAVLRGGTEAGGPDPQVDLIVVNTESTKAGRALDAFGRDARFVIVASRHAASLRAAYAEMKTLSQDHHVENFEVVVPASDGEPASGVVFANLANVARRFLEIEVTDGGTVVVEPPKDLRVNARPPRLVRPRGPASAPSHDGADAFAVPPSNPNPSAEVQHAAVA